MPFSMEEKKYLESMIATQLDLTANDTKKLSEEIAQIQQAFSTTEELPPQNEFKFLQRPTELLPLPGREPPKPASEKKEQKQSKPLSKLTVGEVKLHLLTLVNTAIITAANSKECKAAKFELTEKIWDYKAIQKIITDSKDFNNDYINVKPVAENPPSPYMIHTREGQLFRGWIVVNEKEPVIDIQLEIQLSPNQKISERITGFKRMPYFFGKNANSDQYKFFVQSSIDAYEAAIPRVISIVLAHLEKNKVITSHDSQKKAYSHKLLTYRSYLDALISKKISYPNDLYPLTSEQVYNLEIKEVRELIQSGKSTIQKLKDLSVENLCLFEHSGFQHLLEHDICSIETLHQLSPEQRKFVLCAYYIPKIIDGSLTIKDIKTYTDDECKNMYWPPSLKFLSLNKITLKQIRYMSDGTKELIGIPFYEAQLENNLLNYDDIAYIDDLNADLLKLPAIQTLLKKKLTTINDVIQLPLKTKTLIETNILIQQLIALDLITLDQTKSIYCEEPFDDTTKQNEKQIKDKLIKIKDIFKQIIAEFIPLAKAGILYDTDLHYLFDTVSESVLAKKDEKHIPLLEQPSIMQRYLCNIKNRLQSILDNRPVIFQDDTVDSLKNVYLSCKAFTIPLTPIRNELLAMKIKNCINPQWQNHIRLFICTGKKLGYTPLSTLEHVFGLRLCDIFEKRPTLINDTSDKITTLLNDIYVTAKNLKLDANALCAGAMKFLLLYIKKQGDQELDRKRLAESKYGEITKEISIAVEKNRDAKPDAQPSIWMNCFKRVIERALITTEEAPSLTFFKSKHTMDSASGYKELCVKLGRITEFMVDNPKSGLVIEANLMKP